MKLAPKRRTSFATDLFENYNNNKIKQNLWVIFLVKFLNFISHRQMAVLITVGISNRWELGMRIYAYVTEQKFTFSFSQYNEFTGTG